MNNSSTSTDNRKFIFPYDEKKFAKTISRMTPALLETIKIGVYALNPSGECVNILKSKLSGKSFESLVNRASYTTYEGHYLDLAKIGLV